MPRDGSKKMPTVQSVASPHGAGHDLIDGLEGNDLGFIAVLSGLKTGIQVH